MDGKEDEIEIVSSDRIKIKTNRGEEAQNSLRIHV